MNSKNSGFVLIKLVIAIALVAIVMSVSLQMIGASARAIRDNRQKTAATFFAQQCLEWTRNVRDSAWRQNLPWDCGLQEGTFSIKNGGGNTGSCGKPLGFSINSSASSAPIPGKDPYKRLLTISHASGSEKLTATCQIEWPSNGGGMNQLEMSHILTDWKKN